MRIIALVFVVCPRVIYAWLLRAGFPIYEQTKLRFWVVFCTFEAIHLFVTFYKLSTCFVAEAEFATVVKRTEWQFSATSSDNNKWTPHVSSCNGSVKAHCTCRKMLAYRSLMP